MRITGEGLSVLNGIAPVPVIVGNGGSVEWGKVEGSDRTVKMRVEGWAGGGKNDNSETGMRLIVAPASRPAFARLVSSEDSMGASRRDAGKGPPLTASPITVACCKEVASPEEREVKDVELAAGLVEPAVDTPGTRILLVSAACSGMYKTSRRCIVSEAHILLHLRICATVTPYLSATPGSESVGRT